jgi:two-component system cell cycle sensor histidine kinase/response regulator CckA
MSSQPALRVLLVEDNPGDARLVMEMLREAGDSRFEIETVDTFERGLERLRSAAPDVLLLDLSLPDANGLDTYARAHTEAPAVPVIVVTGLDDEATALRAAEKGAQDYLVKGHFDGDSLVRSIRYAIERHRLALVLRRTVESLHAAQARLNRIVERSADGILVLGSDSRIRFANPEGRRVFEDASESLVGTPFGLPLLREGVGELDVVAGGRQRIIEMRAVEIEWGGEPARLVSLHDVTQRKATEDALRESEARLKEAQRLGRLGHWTYDPAIGRIFWSDVVFEIYGRDPALGPPTPEEEAVYYSPEDARRLRECARCALETGIPWEEDVRLNPPGRAEVYVVAKGKVLRDSEGRATILSGTVQDITERKQAEEELRFQAVLLSTQQEASLDGILVVDDQGKAVSFNQRLVDIWGIPHEVMQSRSDERLWQSVVHKLAAPDEFLARVRWLDEHPQEIGLDEIALADGRTLDRYSAPVVGADGKYYGRVWYFRDITERKRAAEALAREQDLLNKLITNIPDHIYFKDRLSRFTKINLAHARWFGLSDPSDALGKTDSDFFSAEHAQQAYRDEQQIMATGQPVVGLEEKETWPDGRVTWASTTKVPIRAANGEVVGLVGISRDITERKRAEAALRESEGRYRRLHESIRDAFVIVDMSGRILESNRAYQEMLGYTADEVLRLTYLDLTPSQWHGVEARIVADEILPHGHSAVYEKEYIHKNGTVLPVEVCTSLLRNGSGEPAAMWSIVRDVSERKRLEAELLQAQKMEAVGRLAGGVAHDFNNLLSVISGYASLLAPELAVGSDARLKLEEIVKAAERAAGLTRQLLAFSRRQVSQPQSSDLNAVVAEVETMLRRLIGEDVDLVKSCAPDLWPVQADRGQIEQVIMNLAVNARDAMPSGGRLTIATSNVDLGSTAVDASRPRLAGPHVALIVSDTGQGMDRETLAHMFEPFFTTKEVGKGTGLGLATVYGIVKQNGGHIEVESEPGRGSTFKVYLPRRMDAAEAPTERRAAAALAKELRGSETILLVEDEEALALVISEILATAGYEVIQATTPHEALERADSHQGPIHVLLTDVIMPQMNGRDLAGRVRERRGEIKVIFISGYTDDVLGSVLTPDVVFIQKPFSQTALLEKLREVLAT